MKFPERYRAQPANPEYQTNPGDTYGVFVIPAKDARGKPLRVIAVDGEETGWEHVSVSVHDNPKKIPSWGEMCLVKSLFWSDEEEVMQIHPKASEYVNYHHGCLHLWRPVGGFATPPSILVGPKA